MKKIIIYVLMLSISLPVFAQNNETFFEQLTGKYSDQDGFSASMITKDMFDLYLRKRNVDSESPVFEAVKNLDRILVVSQSNLTGNYLGSTGEKNVAGDKKAAILVEMQSAILNHYKNENYTLLKTEKRLGEDVKVYLKKNQDKIESLAVLASSSANTSLVELQGDINLTTVADLSKAMNLRGLDNLSKINNSGNSIIVDLAPTIYSNGNADELIARQRELAERQRVLSEEQRKKFEEQARVQSLRQEEMAERMREMAERYQRQPIFLNYPGDSTQYYINGKKANADEVKQLERVDIKSIEVTNPEKDGDKTTVKIKTK